MITNFSLADKIAFIPSVVWLIIGSYICLLQFNSFIYYLAILIPSLFIWLLLYITHRTRFLGCIILFITGLFTSVIVLSNFKLNQSLPVFLLFSLPVTISGFLFFISSIDSRINQFKLQYSIFKNPPL
jgi:uncharacterized membrane protein YiaA